MKQFLTFVAFFLCLFSIELFAQVSEYTSKSFTTADGLSGNEVQTVCQDHLGVIWIGTITGLNSFDGYSFKNYYNDPSDTTTISNDVIYAIFSDKNQNLWIGTRNGLNLYNRENNNFRRFFHSDTINSISNNLVSYIFQSKDNNLWFGTYDGIDKFDLEDKEFINYRPHVESTNKNWIINIIQDKRGVFWLATYSGGVLNFNPETEDFYYFEHNENNPNSISDNETRALLNDRFGNIWVGTLNGLNILNTTSLNFSNKNNSPKLFKNFGANKILSLHEYSNGDIWIGSINRGLYYFNRQKNTIYSLNKDVNEKNKLTSISITTIISDNDNNLWIGSMQGVNYLYKKLAFHSFLQSYTNKDISLFNNIRAICCDKESNLWIGTSKGVSFFNNVTKEITNFNYNISEQNNINLQVTSIETLQDNRLIIGTNDGVYEFYIPTKQYEKLTPLSGGTILCLEKRSDKEVWIGTYNKGLVKFNPESSDFKIFTHNKDDANSIYSNQITTLSYSGNNTLWIGCKTAIVKFNISNEKFTNYPYKETGLSHDQIHYIYQDVKGIIWIATQKGLNSFNTKTEIFTNYYIQDGLPSNNISSVTDDNNGNIWISTKNGISNFNKKNKRFVNYFENDGLQGDNFNYRAVCKLPDNHIVFGGKQGFTIFCPDSVKNTLEIDTIIIKSFTVLSTKTKKENIFYSYNNLIFKHYQSSFTINFAAVNFHSLNKINYAYKLENLENNWKALNKQRSVSFLELPSGKYKFQVKAYDINPTCKIL